MEIMLAGLVLFSLLHFVPCLFHGLKLRWVGAMGVVGYKVSFSIVAIISIAIIAYGWQNTVPGYINTPL